LAAAGRSKTTKINQNGAWWPCRGRDMFMMSR
jgi:hypothetical protein